MTMQSYGRTLRKGWWVILIAMVLGIGGGVLINERATPVYASTVSFFVSTPSGASDSSFASDQFAQHRANSYALLLSSEQLGSMIKSDTKLDLTPAQIAASVVGAADLNTVILTATVKNTSPQKSLTIARSVSTQFPVMVTKLETHAGKTADVALNVVSGPTLRASAVSPNRTVNLLLGLAAGLGIGIVLALLRGLLDTSFRSTETLTERTDLPVLAAFDRDAAVGRSPLVVGAALRSRRAETYRQLRTNLLFVHVDRPLQTLVVTSSVPMEGKSTVAANLALTFAGADRRVLLIEADLRKPSIGTLFGIEGGLGLTNVLAGQSDIDDVLQPSGHALLTILPAGPVPPNPSEMLGSDTMIKLLELLRERFDTIIIDTPPLLPVTDAAVLASITDGTVMIVRYGKTTQAQVEASLAHLAAVDAPVLGAILTMRPPRSAPARGSYSYDEKHTGGRPQLEDLTAARRNLVPVARSLRPARAGALEGSDPTDPTDPTDPIKSADRSPKWDESDPDTTDPWSGPYPGRRASQSGGQHG